MLSAQRIPRKSGGLTPVLPLVRETAVSAEEERGKYISFLLKSRVGQPDAGTKYKKYVRMFEEGSPQMWIDLVKDAQEIWTQNSMAGGADRAFTVRSLVRGESLTAFETALQTARTDAEGVEAAITQAHVDTSMAAVAATVFPHRALETQRLWMNRSMYKPKDLTTRMTSAAINRINNAIPHFPTATEASKFPEAELLALLEWSLPAKWRETFDLKGYIPTEHNRTRLIAECEAIERHVKADDTPKTTEKKGNNNKKKNGRFDKSKSSARTSETAAHSNFYCTEHGKNESHNTNKCWTLENRKKTGSQGHKSNNRSFSKNSFRKELNLLSRKSSKTQVLDLYESTIKQERKKIAKRQAKRKASEPDSESDESDSDVSVHNMEKANGQKRSKKKANTSKRANAVKLSSRIKSALKKKSKIPTEEGMEEETAYQKKVEWLKDHGESDKDEPLGESEGSDDST
jgi:hypothetical protein